MSRRPGARSLTFLEHLQERWPDLTEQAVAHALVVLLAIAIATAISVAFAVLAYRVEWASGLGIGVAAGLLTIPSLALFGLLIPVFGLGYVSTLVGLVVYALLPIVRNAVVGLRGVDAAVVEAAAGMGMSRWHRLARIELPLAWPVILTGIRVSTMLTLGIATIAAIINGPGLGEDIFRGLARLGGARALELTLGGTLGVVVLALLFDVAFVALRRLTTPRGLR